MNSPAGVPVASPRTVTWLPETRIEMAMLRPSGTPGVFEMGAQELVALAASRRTCRRQPDEPGESRGGRGQAGATYRRLGAAFLRHRSHSGWFRFAGHLAFDCDGRDVASLPAGQQRGSISDRAAPARDDLEHRPKRPSRDEVAARSVATCRQKQICRSRRLKAVQITRETRCV